VNGEGRPVWARLGLVLLNLPVPGLGLLRLGEGRRALLFFSAPLLAYLSIIAFYAAAPLSFTGYLVSSGLVLALAAVLYVSSSTMTWRRSRERSGDLRWWSRWYAILLAYAAAVGLLTLLVQIAHLFYKPYYLPSQGMAPTLVKGARIVAAMGPVRAPRRGEILIFRVDRWIYVQRVAGLPGDRIAMRAGVVVLNGRPVPQRLVGEEVVRGPSGATRARRLIERLPGEPRPHAIYDLGRQPEDDMPEQQVAPGHVFMLGDNRDMTADSRVPVIEMGVEQLPIDGIIGRALFVTWDPTGLSGRDLR
jgi:signal peptidase I